MITGDVRTYKDGMSQVLVLEWSGVLNDDFVELLDMWANNTSSIKIYLDPISYPSEYETYYLDWENLKGSSKHPSLSRTGVQEVKLKFIKVYNG
jgi:hypothetical protein